jgi:hypothetical protein
MKRDWPGPGLANFKPGALHRTAQVLDTARRRLLSNSPIDVGAARGHYDGGARGLERSVLVFAGMKPVRETPIGMMDAASDAERQGWLDRMKDHGGRLV